jgi:hypothetical protein
MGGMARTPLRVVLIAGLIASGCSWGGPDETRTPPPDWETVEETTSEPGLVIEKVRYRSGNLSIVGQVCRPDTEGPHPVLIWNHGGYAGLTDWNDPDGACAQIGRSGWVFAESSYRGEDGSDGRLEICDGEVDDVLAMLEVIRAKPYADAKRIAMTGMSHGGCITARAVARDAPVQVAVDYAGPADWTQQWRYMTRRVNARSTNVALRRVYTGLLTSVETAMGGTPAEAPEEYARRSPLRHAEKIAAWDGDFLVMHGAADSIVPARQACALVGAVGGFEAYRFGETGRVMNKQPAVCRDSAFNGRPGPGDEFPAPRYFLLYDGVDHTFGGFLSGRVNEDYERFITAKLTP